MIQISSSEQVIQPVVKSMLIRLPVDAAFRLFTAEVSRWWPLASHSVFGDEAVSCHLEGFVGGRFYEVHTDQRQSEWGRVKVWEPPERVVFSFYPGRQAADSTEVEVTFRAEASGTRLTLTHRGWDQVTPKFQKERDNYDHGWEFVLGKFTQAAAKAS